jgi:transcriptional regulator with XRE-family HTH domain
VPEDTLLTVLRYRIRQARVGSGLTQEEAAEKVGLPLRSYQRFEGRRITNFNPTLMNAHLVSQAFGLSLDALLQPLRPEEKSGFEAWVAHRVRRGHS